MQRENFWIRKLKKVVPPELRLFFSINKSLNNRPANF